MYPESGNDTEHFYYLSNFTRWWIFVSHIDHYHTFGLTIRTALMDCGETAVEFFPPFSAFRDSESLLSLSCDKDQTRRVLCIILAILPLVRIVSIPK